MYIFVTVTEPGAYYDSGPDGQVKARLEQGSGERCLTVPYREFGLNVVRELRPRAIVMSGFGGHFEDRDVRHFHGMSDAMHEAEVPMLCICGSHQLLGFAFNRDLRKVRRLRDQPMRRLRPGEHWPRQPQGADPRFVVWRHFHAQGFLPIRRLRPDPLFAGLPRTMILRCSHYCEVKRLPRGFVALAESDHCRIEAMRHAIRPLYGVQFHPEKYAEPFLDGRKLLANFAAIVNAFWTGRRP